VAAARGWTDDEDRLHLSEIEDGRWKIGVTS